MIARRAAAAAASFLALTDNKCVLKSLWTRDSPSPRLPGLTSDSESMGSSGSVTSGTKPCSVMEPPVGAEAAPPAPPPSPPTLLPVASGGSGPQSSVGWDPKYSRRARAAKCNGNPSGATVDAAARACEGPVLNAVRNAPVVGPYRTSIVPTPGLSTGACRRKLSPVKLRRTAGGPEPPPEDLQVQHAQGHSETVRRRWIVCG
jgi:hypothetical protein